MDLRVHTPARQQGDNMIAVMTEKHRGVRRLEPEVMAHQVARHVLQGLQPTERQLLANLLSQGIDVVDHPAFHDRRSARAIEASIEKGIASAHAQAKLLPIDLSGNEDIEMPAFQTLSQSQEAQLFLAMNYCRHRVLTAMTRHGKSPITVKLARSIVLWTQREHQLRDQLAQANLPLVLAMARRIRSVGTDFAEIVSEGNLALLRSIDKFDAARGFKFSTYACRAILKAFSRVAMKATRYRTHFPTEFDPELEKGDHLEAKREDATLHCVDEIRDILGGQGDQLTEIEKRVLRFRFAIAGGNGSDADTALERPMTLEEVGTRVGLTKERVRQIQNKALSKLRDALEDDVLTA
jgi:RNA polymerase sigma factor (sigma-70 family)